MLFNSLSFALFLPAVFILYWFGAGRSLKKQNIILLVSSYFFYACWDYRFLFLLVFSTLLDFFTGIMMERSDTQRKRRFWFWLSIGINLGFLGFFKYYNFFITSFAEGLAGLGITINYWTLQVILPVGISFYTFHGLSYVIDIYNRKIKAERNFIEYSVFVSFFPLLVAGPIERATHLLPQIQKKRSFDSAKAIDGLRQILWGLFKKIVIADNCATVANAVFGNSSAYGGSTLLVGAVFFAFQIYCDFSGYSDIALGTAKLFGVDLLRNFAYPYFSRDIAEFWRRWHISLSTWFRDYLYIPLGGSKGSTWKKVRNVAIIFVVSGFWHGANWTFIVWGLLNAIYIMPSILLNTNRDNLAIVAEGKILPSLKDLLSICLTFGLAVLAWIFFRADNITHALHYIKALFSSSLFSVPQFLSYKILFLLAGFILVEWVGREYLYAIQGVRNIQKPWIRIAIYYIVIACILLFGNFSENKFIYFQF